jgi:hypothetical protein
MKVCSKCKKDIPYSEFHKHKYSKDGYRSQGKVCRKEKDIEYYIENNLSDMDQNFSKNTGRAQSKIGPFLNFYRNFTINKSL